MFGIQDFSVLYIDHQCCMGRVLVISILTSMMLFIFEREFVYKYPVFLAVSTNV